MPDTPRTDAALLTLFAAGQAAGSLNSQDVRDLIVSKTNILDAIATARLGSGTADGTSVLFGDSVWRALTDANIAPVAPFTIATPGATPAAIWTLARQQQVMTLTQNATVTVSAIPAGGALLLRVIQAASGGPYTLAHAASGMGALFPDLGVTPIMSSGASKIDDYLYRFDGTRTVYARILTAAG